MWTSQMPFPVFGFITASGVTINPFSFGLFLPLATKALKHQTAAHHVFGLIMGLDCILQHIGLLFNIGHSWRNVGARSLLVDMD